MEKWNENTNKKYNIVCVCKAVWASMPPQLPRVYMKAANYELNKCQRAVGLGTQQPFQPHYI